ncbi:hypothetical protein CTAYLR_000562 [Chrysophaeum taylorii]|uniref:Calpain catalytic domain-containing protein n=1 Tax=Chrysophaeum taylorii TaxID=2483200 RepID=A0AAD7UGY4_9STRA|nr:hypothetical protein CTAYLR_000562 [Chrysophaeum taylorii]
MLGCDRQTCMIRSDAKCSSRRGCATKTIVCVANVIGTPWCLAFHAVVIYVFPCIYFSLEWFLFGLCRCCPKFEDRKFPASEASIGPIKASAKKIEWKRLDGDRLALFQGGVDASDVCQGALGNCWLLSAVACLCEFDGAVQHLFLDKQRNPRGKYRIRLYDVQASKWRVVAVDDRIPHINGKPAFSQPHGDELWVLLLEKAFAKFCGNYAAIESGAVVWAFEAMTGDSVACYKQQKNGEWEHLDMRPKEGSDDKRAVSLYHSGRVFTRDNMFELLCRYDGVEAVLGAGSRGEDHTLTRGRDEKRGGIVPGHAYSIISAAERKGVKLLKLRNPWGSFEWDGKWSDGSSEWKDRPDVARAFHYYKADDDGTFFMEWSDFCARFDSIDVCVRTTGMSEFVLQVDEKYGACGPTVGCCKGMCQFLCLCKGLWKMWCGKHSSDALVKDIERDGFSAE